MKAAAVSPKSGGPEGMRLVLREVRFSTGMLSEIEGLWFGNVWELFRQVLL